MTGPHRTNCSAANKAPCYCRRGKLLGCNDRCSMHLPWRRAQRWIVEVAIVPRHGHAPGDQYGPNKTNSPNARPRTRWRGQLPAHGHACTLPPRGFAKPVSWGSAIRLRASSGFDHPQPKLQCSSAAAGPNGCSGKIVNTPK